MYKRELNQVTDFPGHHKVASTRIHVAARSSIVGAYLVVALMRVEKRKNL